MARPSLANTRREEILDALERCLARRGLEGTTLESVAAEAGVARPVIRHYFGNRDVLLKAALEAAASEALARIPGWRSEKWRVWARWMSTSSALSSLVPRHQESSFL